MDDALILAELQAQARTMPTIMLLPVGIDPHGLTPDDYQWLGRTVALLGLWSRTKSLSARVAAQGLHPSPMFQSNVGTIQLTIHEAIADLMLRLQHNPGGAFAAGSVFDFFRELRNVVGLATRDLLVIDPYLNDEIFTYLSVAPAGVSLRLMMTEPRLVPIVKTSQAKFQQQYQRQVESRATASIHDRVVFIDGRTCYILGASIKDAAQKKPTYLAPLAADLVPDKLTAYEAIWQSAVPI
jgi:hypothetical protein